MKLTFEAPTEEYRQELITGSMAQPLARRDLPYARTDIEELVLVCSQLFKMGLNERQFLHPDADNGIEHHPIVVGHMMRIVTPRAAQGRLSWDDFTVAAAASLLHDLCPVRRITGLMIKAARTYHERQRLEEERARQTPAHMIGSANMAMELLTAAEKTRSVPFFKWSLRKRIYDLIVVHDNPKIGLPLPPCFLETALREADRAYMATPVGIHMDLLRR